MKKLLLLSALLSSFLLHPSSFEVRAADLSITAANVAPSSKAKASNSALAGTSITAGNTLYISSTDSKAYLADSNGTGTTVLAGVAANTAGINQVVNYTSEDDSFTIGATVTVGETYILSSTAGKVAPIGDVATGWVVDYLGVGKTSTTINLKVVNTGVTHAWWKFKRYDNSRFLALSWLLNHPTFAR